MKSTFKRCHNIILSLWLHIRGLKKFLQMILTCNAVLGVGGGGEAGQTLPTVTLNLNNIFNI